MKGGLKQQILQIDIAAAVACIAIAAAWYWGVLSPALSRQRQQMTEQLQLEQIKLHADSSMLSCKSAQHQLESIEQAMARNASRLQPADDANREVEQITDFAAFCRMDVPGFHAGDFASGRGYLVLPIYLEGRASFSQLADFVSGLPRVCPGVGCESIRIGDGSVPQNLSGDLESFAIELRWYALPTKMDAGRRAAAVTASAGE